MEQPLATEDLLRPSLAARLCFAKGLHGRLAEASPLAELAEDVVERILSFVVGIDLVEVPGTACAGAHTNNPQYFSYTDDSLVLRDVCWLAVAICAKAVPKGRYAVQLHLTAGGRFDLATKTSVRPTGSEQWAERCPEFSWSPNNKGKRGILTLGEVTIDAESDVQVGQQNTEGGWKSGVIWHKLCLVPLAPAAPAVEQRWALEGEEEVIDAWQLVVGGGGSGGGGGGSSGDAGSGKEKCIIT
jgi:hypothetical protein